MSNITIPPMHEYQKAAVKEMLNKKKLGLFLEMGLGKSRCCCEMLKEFTGKKTLIIAPKMVVQNVWKQEFEKWFPEAKVAIIAGSAKKRKKIAEEEADVYVISRDNFQKLLDSRIRRYDILIIDESTSFKNPSTKRFKNLKRYLYTFERIYLLSGLPNPNGYMDLFSQIYILDNGKRFGRSFQRFKETYFFGFPLNGYMVYTQIKRGAKEEINAKIKDITYALQSKDYLKLPPKIINNIHVKLSDAEYRNYKELEKHYVLGKEVTAANAAVLYQKLSQLSSGFIYKDDGDIEEFGTAKLETVKEIVECNPENVLVLYKYIRDKELLLEAGGRLIQSAKDVEDWNAGKIHFAVAAAEKMIGLNMQKGGHHVIWFSLIWDLEVYEQANARLLRQGQEFPVTITHLIAEDTIDERVLEALRNKKTDSDALMLAVKGYVEEKRR